MGVIISFGIITYVQGAFGKFIARHHNFTMRSHNAINNTFLETLLGLIRASRKCNWMLHLAIIKAMILWLFAYDRLCKLPASILESDTKLSC